MSGLDAASQEILKNVIDNHFAPLFTDLTSQENSTKTVQNHINYILGQTLPLIGSENNGAVVIDKKTLTLGKYKEPFDDPKFIATPHVKKNISNVVRALHAKRYPILLQGETSTGKTSLINYLAKLMGYNCIRLNNHEHTDLSEYIGNYESDAKNNGKLVFKEGPLITAMKNGDWIILDELNLAPSDVLEALNRLLDDNREIFIPETQEMVKANEHFQLFATQNPPSTYAGRKQLSKAFRNRFLELHFDDIPLEEIEVVIEKRCQLPKNYCKKLVAVMRNLVTHRSADRAFSGKNTLITLRDLFKWADRYTKDNDTNFESQGKQISGTEFRSYDWEQHLANDGYMILAGRSRDKKEQETIRKTIEKVFKRKIIDEEIFDISETKNTQIYNLVMKNKPNHFVLTSSTKRSLCLLYRAAKFNEPVLLVGHTGSGKTSLCEIISEGPEDSKTGVNSLKTIQCHQNTESMDFIGGLRPAEKIDQENGKLFTWKNGPLIEAMLNGVPLLIDEISLADDSVIERLNSVLEIEQSLVVPEVSENAIYGKEGFKIFATMNPGGDYGKKELSPALANRFTVVWCETPTTEDQLSQIILHNLF